MSEDKLDRLIEGQIEIKTKVEHLSKQKNDHEKRIRKLEKMNKLDKKIGDMEQNVKKGTVKDIIKREHELLDQDTDEEEVHKILEEEFGEERMNKAQETKSWRNRK